MKYLTLVIFLTLMISIIAAAAEHPPLVEANGSLFSDNFSSKNALEKYQITGNASIKNGELVLCDTMEAIRKKLGKREYEVVFKADSDLDYERQGDNYVFRATDVGQMASLLRNISEKNWALIDLSVQHSALEDMYVELMRDADNP